MKTGIIYSVCLYQRGVVIQCDREKEYDYDHWGGGGRGNASPSYNPLGMVIFLVSLYIATISLFHLHKFYRVLNCQHSIVQQFVIVLLDTWRCHPIVVYIILNNIDIHKQVT